MLLLDSSDDRPAARVSTAAPPRASGHPRFRAMSRIRACRDDERDAILAIVNAAAEAYRGVIPADRWHEPYMPAAELDAELAAGVAFLGYEDERRAARRHGHPARPRRPAHPPRLRRAGRPGPRHRRRAARPPAGRRRAPCSSAPGPPPPGRSASTSATASSPPRASGRPSCCGPTGRSPSARSRRRSSSVVGQLEQLRDRRPVARGGHDAEAVAGQLGPELRARDALGCQA